MITKINEIAREIGREIKIMEVCGTHTSAIARYGIKSVLPKNIRLVSGPGCPVCVTSQHDIDCMIELALQGIHVSTYGDMMRVPGSKSSLDDVRMKGAKIDVVYSADEVKDGVFFGVGFETTAPMTAAALKRQVAVYSVHKLIPPAMKLLVSEKYGIDGFINPGHVSVIIGSDVYKDIAAPQVVSGFEPENILESIYKLLLLIKERRNEVVNNYSPVSNEGNELAKRLISEHFKLCDSEWRGLGKIPQSGLEVKDSKLNAKTIYSDVLKNVKAKENPACNCGDILRGILEPRECRAFGKGCIPERPLGPCMVSGEGACRIVFEND